MPSTAAPAPRARVAARAAEGRPSRIRRARVPHQAAVLVVREDRSSLRDAGWRSCAHRAQASVPSPGVSIRRGRTVGAEARDRTWLRATGFGARLCRCRASGKWATHSHFGIAASRSGTGCAQAAISPTAARISRCTEGKRRAPLPRLRLRCELPAGDPASRSRVLGQTQRDDAPNGGVRARPRSAQCSWGERRATSASASEWTKPSKLEDHGPKLSWPGPKS